MKKRVVVTGLGVITSNAQNASEFLSALKQGKSGISIVQSFDTSKLRVQIGGEIKGLEPPLAKMDRVSQLALIAAQEALKDANLRDKKAGVVFGTLSGGALTFEKLLLEGESDPYLVSKLSSNSPAQWIAQIFKLKGSLATLSNACAAGTVALGYALDQIRYGKMDLVLAGGSETFNLTTFAGFHALRSLDPVACRPFDRERQGLVIGEGAGFLLLESLEHAKERGAKIYAEVLGYGLSSDAYHETAPDPTGDGAARAMEGALLDAGLQPEEVTYINAHGTGTLQNDMMETLAIKKVFNEYAYKISVSSVKSMIGHLMGAAGAVEGVASVLALKHSFIPPTINYKVPDPECDLDYVPNQSREQKVKVVLSNNFGFGGSNASIAFKKIA